MTFRVTVVIPASYRWDPCGVWITFDTSHLRMSKLRIPITQRQTPKRPPPGLTEILSTESTVRTGSTKIGMDRTSGAATRDS